MIRRIGTVALILACMVLSCWNTAAAAGRQQVKVQTPAVFSALPLFWMDDQGLLDVDLDIQISPDHLRGIALIAQNDIDLLVTGVSVGAKAYNKGIGLQLVNTNVWGIDYLLANFPVNSWADLRGKTLSVPLQGGPVDFLARCFLVGHGVDPNDVTFVYRASNNAAVAFQLGQIDAVILPEPLVTVTLRNCQEAEIAFDLQDEWAKLNDGEYRIPYVGLFAGASFANEHPELVKRINQLYQEGIDWIKANPGEAAGIAEKYLGQQAAVVEEALERVDLNLYPDDAGLLIKQYFEAILGLYPEMIGGRLPDAEFYFH